MRSGRQALPGPTCVSHGDPMVALLSALAFAGSLTTGGTSSTEIGMIPGQYLSMHMVLASDGTTTNANGNYSGGAVIFEAQPAAGEVWSIARLLVTVEDNGVWREEWYAGTGSALTNGISIRVSNDSGVMVTITDAVTIHTHGDWGHYCYDNSFATTGSGDNVQRTRWSFFKASASGRGLRLIGDNNERLEIVLEDDFSSVSGQFFVVQGTQL